MATPFKNLSGPAKNTNEYLQKKVAVVGPGKRNSPLENGDGEDVIPDHPPCIPWPPAEPVDHKPMKGMK